LFPANRTVECNGEWVISSNNGNGDDDDDGDDVGIIHAYG